jgi:hypothetical protein
MGSKAMLVAVVVHLFVMVMAQGDLQGGLSNEVLLAQMQAHGEGGEDGEDGEGTAADWDLNRLKNAQAAFEVEAQYEQLRLGREEVLRERARQQQQVCMCCSVLLCVVMCCPVMCCPLLSCAMQCCNVLCRPVLPCATLCCPAE